MAGNHRSIPELELRIRSEQVNEGVRIAGIDNCKYTPPPSTIALYGIGEHDIKAQCEGWQSYCTAYSAL